MDRRRESSVQRRATSAVKSERAAGCADEMMQQLLEDGRGENRETGAEKGSTKTGGGLLEALGPVGPPLTFSPIDPPSLVDSGEVRKTPKVETGEKQTPGVKRVVVSESTGDPQRSEEQHRPRLGSVSEAVPEHGFRDGTGKGRGSGSEGRRIITRMTDTPEMLLETRNPRGNVQGNQSQEAKGSQRECERFYIGEGVSVLQHPRKREVWELMLKWTP